MDFALDAEQELVVATIRRFAERNLRAWATTADADATTPANLMSAASEMGFFVDAVPATADGMLEGSYSHVTRALRSYELGRGCAAFAALLETNVEPALAASQWGSAALQAELFASLTSGGIATTARDTTGTLQLTTDGPNDVGVYVTGRIGPAPGLAIASHVLLLAQLDGAPIVLMVPTAIEQGQRDAIAPSGWRAAAWGTLTLTHARISEANILARGVNAQLATDCILAWHRTSLAARAAGVAATAMEHAENYGRERVQFGQPIGRFESLIRLREDGQTAAATARLAALFAGWACDQIPANTANPDAAAVQTAWNAASRAHIVAGDAVSKSTIDAVQIFGGYGFVADYPVEKLMRDARAFEALLGDARLERTLRALQSSHA
jgi:alkylation response protein AidB-like acyl-CoA dehydrogenase